MLRCGLRVDVGRVGVSRRGLKVKVPKYVVKCIIFIKPNCYYGQTMESKTERGRVKHGQWLVYIMI
jgi:hypothetical protein